VLFGLRHNMPDDVVGELFGCPQATITRYHDLLRPILRWVTGPEVDEQYRRAQREGVAGYWCQSGVGGQSAGGTERRGQVAAGGGQQLGTLPVASTAHA
jgi:hypothetical protein